MSSRKWSHLLIHHSASGPREKVGTIRVNHVEKRGFSDIGYHYVIERDFLGFGHMKRARPDTRSGGHAGKRSETFDRRDWNAFSIGLCVVGYFHPGSTVSEKMTGRLYRAVLGAAVHLCRKYDIPADNVKFHREVKATACPGEWFPMGQLRADIKKALADD